MAEPAQRQSAAGDNGFRRGHRVDGVSDEDVDAKHPTRVGLQNSTLSRPEALARAIELDLVDGVFDPRERLGTKEQLRRRYSVAGSTVTDAIKLLIARGLVDARPGPGGGIFVASASARPRQGPMLMGFEWEHASIRELSEVLEMIEPTMIRNAAASCDEAAIESLSAIVERMQEAVEDPVEYVRLNTHFHRQIAKLTRNAPLRSMYVTLLDHFERGLLESTFSIPIAPKNIEVHRTIVDAIASGDTRTLNAAIRRHTHNRRSGGLFGGANRRRGGDRRNGDGAAPAGSDA